MYNFMPPHPSQPTEQPPILSELQCLKSSAGTVRIIDSIAYKWESVAIQLTIPTSKVKTIKRDTDGAEDACRIMLGIWLKGGHKTPVNWRTFIDCLRDSDSEFKVLAHDLEQALRVQTEQVEGAAPASLSVGVQSSEEASGEQQSLHLQQSCITCIAQFSINFMVIMCTLWLGRLPYLSVF